MKNRQYRHGDVLLQEIPATQVPKSAPQAADRILAHGEATGHAHRLASGTVLLDGAGLAQVARTTETTPLTHEEHGLIPVPKGNFRIVHQVEYVPSAIPRRVVD